MSTLNNPFLEAALQYVEKGFKVFPCRLQGKAPLTPNGVKNASSDPEEIKRWWAQWPNANIGLPTGSANHCFAIDVDERHNGISSLRELESRLEKLPATPKNLTSGGGYHLLFFLPENVTVHNAVHWLCMEGIDVRGEGGYIIVPPSIHPSGCQYHWDVDFHIDEVTLAVIPEAWLNLLIKGNKEEKKPSNSSPILGTSVSPKPYGWVAGALKGLKEGDPPPVERTERNGVRKRF